MTHSDTRTDCLERARMHDRLATSTNDVAAQQMHQAMAAEYRRRAAQADGEAMPNARPDGPLIELVMRV